MLIEGSVSFEVFDTAGAGEENVPKRLMAAGADSCGTIRVPLDTKSI